MIHSPYVSIPIALRTGSSILNLVSGNSWIQYTLFSKWCKVLTFCFDRILATNTSLLDFWTNNYHRAHIVVDFSYFSCGLLIQVKILLVYHLHNYLDAKSASEQYHSLEYIEFVGALNLTFCTWASFFNETSSIVVNFGKTWFIFLFTVNIQHDVLDLSFLLLILYSSECEFWYMITCSTLVSLLETSSLLRNILFFIMHRRCTWVITSFSYLSSGRRACSNLLLYHKMYASLHNSISYLSLRDFKLDS